MLSQKKYQNFRFIIVLILFGSYASKKVHQNLFFQHTSNGNH